MIFDLRGSCWPNTGVAVLLLVFFGAHSLWAATEEDAWLAEPKCRFASQFTQTRAFPDGVNYLRTAGQLYFDCEHGLIWSMEAPISSTQVFQASGDMYDLDRTGSVRVLDNSIQRRVGSLLSALLKGNRSQLEESFTLQADQDALVLKPRGVLLRQVLRRIVIRRGTEAGARLVMIEQTDDQVLTVTIAPLRPAAPDSTSEQSCVEALGSSRQRICQTLLLSQGDMAVNVLSPVVRQP